MDVHMLQWAMGKSVSHPDFIVVDDGEPALAFLRGEKPYEGALLPDLVVLDLNLRRVDGPAVLTAIRETESLRHLAVIIFSSSPEDVMRSAAHTADGYFKKPNSLEGYTAIAESIDQILLRGIRQAT